MNSDPLAATVYRPWVIMKFGGTSVATAARWWSIADLVRQRIQEGFKPLVVVSALSGVTNLLLEIIEARGEPSIAKTLAAAIRTRHNQLANDLHFELPAAFAHWLDRLDILLSEPRAARMAFDWQAEILAIGELLSSSFGAAWFTDIGINVCWLDSRSWLHSIKSPHESDWSRWLSVNCSVAPEAARAAALATQADVFIVPGFIAQNSAGQTVVLGRGGSDTSAAYFGAILGATRVEIWTDVAGMFSTDPSQVPNARLLVWLDFEEAQEIATTGAKVLHPRSLAPLREVGVPMWIKDSNHPELPGTVIAPHSTDPTLNLSDVSVKAVSQRRGVMLVAMESIGMWRQVGFLADVFARFRRHGLSVDLIGSAETNVTVSLDPTENLVTADVLEALCADLAQVCHVKVIGPCTAITLVGRDMRRLLSKLSGVWAEVGSIPVHLVSQSSNNLNLTFVVDDSAAEGLLARVHDSLIRTRALRQEDTSIFGPSWESLYQSGVHETVQPWWQAKSKQLLTLAQERTPRYVYDRATLSARAHSLQRIAAVDQWFYATKANTHPAILRQLANIGFGLECVSIGELQHADAVAPMATKLYTSNFAPVRELAVVSKTNVAMTIDNASLIAKHADMFCGRELLLRIDLGVGRGHHDKVKTGGVASKFGITIADLATARQDAERGGARIIGLHAHLGSGILSVKHFKEVYAELAALAKTIPSVSILNIGGGIGVPSRPEDQALDLDELAKQLAEVKALYPQFKLWMEPGRFLVAEAGVLLARVTQTKHKGGIHYVGIDAGMHNLIRPALYDAWHPIVNLTRMDIAPDAKVQIVGPICESGDVIGVDRSLPHCEEGDVILIAQAGAYGAVMASNYNRRASADEIML